MNPKKYVYPPLESIIPFRYRIQKTGLKAILQRSFLTTKSWKYLNLMS